MQSLKIFLLLRDIIGWFRLKAIEVFNKGTENDPSATLMERMVGEQTIPLNSEAYKNGKEQFEENLDFIIQKSIKRKVRVLLGELVSNIRDLEPFISLEERDEESAKAKFLKARYLESKGKVDEAREYYKKAKDLDALRFRAPEDFYEILKKLSQKYSLPLVPTVSSFEGESHNGIIGNQLMLEHVHPNIRGYALLAKSFYMTLKEGKFISDEWRYSKEVEEYRNTAVTELDSVYGAITIQQLKSGWPFQPKNLPNKFFQNFHPQTKLEELAFKVNQSQNFSLEVAHMELGKYYEKQGKPDKALGEYLALIASIPTEMEFYQKTATMLLLNNMYNEAEQILMQSLKYKDTYFAYKWIGQIALMKDDYQKAIFYLSKADQLDNQVIFNLARAYYNNGQVKEGDEYYNQLKRLSPNAEYFRYLTQMRTMIHLKNKAN